MIALPVRFAPALLLMTYAMPAAAQVAAAAPQATSALPITGSVPDLCILGDPRLDTGSAALNVNALTGRILRIAALTDPTNLSTRPVRASLAFDAACNYPYTLTVASRNNGLWRQTIDTPTPNGFGNAVPYIADVTWQENSVRLNADATTRAPKSAGFSSATAAAGTIRIDFRVLPGATNALANAPLVAGDYTDTLTVTLGAQ